MSDLTNDGTRLVREWLLNVERVKRLRADLNRAEVDAKNAEAALSRWLLPPDSTAGEKVAVWFGDSLIQATAEGKSGLSWTGPVVVRIRGPRLDEVLR